MSMSDPSGVVVPCLYDSSGGYVMSLQKTSVPALAIDAGAVIDAPLPEVVVVVDSLLFLLLPPQPLPAKARRRTIAPASTKVFERNTGGAPFANRSPQDTSFSPVRSGEAPSRRP